MKPFAVRTRSALESEMVGGLNVFMVTSAEACGSLTSPQAHRVDLNNFENIGRIFERSISKRMLSYFLICILQTDLIVRGTLLL